MSRLKLTNKRLTDRQRVALWMKDFGVAPDPAPSRLLRGLVTVGGRATASDSAKGAIGQTRRR